MGDKPIKLTTESRPFSGDLPQSSNCSICHSSSQPTDPFAEINQSIPPDPSANVSVDTSNGESVSSAPVNSSEPNFNSMFWGGDFYSSFISDRKQSLFQWGVNAGGQISKPMPEVIPDLPDHKKIFDGMKLGYGEARIGESSLNEMHGIVESAAELAHLETYLERWRDARDRLQGAERELKEIEGRHSRLKMAVCHGDPKASDYHNLAPYYEFRDYLASIEKTSRQQLDLAMARFDQTMYAVVTDQMFGDRAEGIGLPHDVDYLMAQKLEGLGDNDHAIEYYNLAAKDAAVQKSDVVQSMAYRLEALRVEAVDKPERIEEHVLPEIQKIYDGIPLMMASLMEGNMMASAAGLGEDSATRMSDVAQPNVSPVDLSLIYGTQEVLSKLNINVLRVTYIASLSALSQPDLDSDDQVKFKLLRVQIEDKLRDEMQSRTGGASPEEKEAFLYAFQNVVNTWTMKGGVIEQELRENGDKAAKVLYEQLANDLAIARKLTDLNTGDMIAGNSIYEKLATLEWQVYFDGMRSRDLPATGLKNLSSIVVPHNRKSNSIAIHLAELRNEARVVGIEKQLFNDDGTLKSDFDLSELPEGISAGDRTRAAYMQPPGLVRGIGVPILGGTTSYGVAAALSVTNPIALGLVIAGGMALGVGGNYIYDTRVRGGNAYEEATKSGLSRISGDEAASYRKGYYMYAAVMTIPFPAIKPASNFIGGIAVGAGRNLIKFPALAVETISRNGFLRAVGKGAVHSSKFVGEGLKLGGQGLMKLSWPARINVVGGLSAMGVDYGFLNSDYQFVLGDGKIDTIVGNAGKALLMAELYYQIFRLTWRSGVKEVNGKTYTGFADWVNNAPLKWPKVPIRLGADAMMADKYLVKMNDIGEMDLVNFSAPRDTLGEQIADNMQYQIDTWPGYLGAAAFLAPWGISEFRNFPIYINTPSRVNFARGRVVAGGSLVGLDYLDGDGEFNKWYSGGVGGSLLANEMISCALGVDPAGSLVSTGIRIVWEWLNQYVQDQPLQAPDAQRLMWASTESNLMRFFNKGFVMGYRTFKNYPLGQRMIEAHQWMKTASWSPIRLVSRFKSLQGLTGDPVLLPGERALKANMVKPDKSKTVELKYDGRGRPRAKPHELTVLESSKGGTAVRVDGKKYTIVSGKEGNTPIDDYVADSGEVSGRIKDVMQRNGYLANGGRLYKVEPQYMGFVRLKTNTSQTITPESLNRLSPHERTSLLARLQSEEDIYFDEIANQFYQIRIKDPNAAYAFSSHGGYKGARVSTDEKKVMRIGFGKKDSGEVWLSFPRERVLLDSAEVGGKKITLFTGSVSKPRISFAGSLYNMATIPTTAYLLNKHIFSKVMDGDPEYQGMTRWTHYALCEGIVHPYIMWPLGFDGALPQLVGRGILTPFIALEAKLFPSYLDSMPGFKLYNRRLFDVQDDQTGSVFADNAVRAAKAVSSTVRMQEWGDGLPIDSPLDVVASGISSLQVDPILGMWGMAEGSKTYIEPRGTEAFLQQENCVEDVMFHGKSLQGSEACGEMHPRLQRNFGKEIKQWGDVAKKRGENLEKLYVTRAKNLADNFSQWMEAEREAISGSKKFKRLNALRRRTLVVMAGQIMQKLRDAKRPDGTYKDREAIEPYIALSEKYPFLFSDHVIPPLNAKDKWTDFIHEVNTGKAEAPRFPYYLDPVNVNSDKSE